jgi:hypothetical protein
MIFLTLIIGAVFTISFLVGLSHIEEAARENIEHDKPCESYQILKWTSIFTQESKYLLGTIYSRGTCLAQDIPRAKDLYAYVYKNDPERIARALFHDAIQLADFDERNHRDKKSENIRALLLESKKMGLHPTDRELGDLSERGLKEVFMDSSTL